MKYLWVIPSAFQQLGYSQTLETTAHRCTGLDNCSANLQSTVELVIPQKLWEYWLKINYAW